MDGYTLERLGSNPSHEKWRPPQGAPTTQPLYQGAENAGRTQDRRVASARDVERKVVSSSPTADKDFSGRFSSSNSRDNVDKCQMPILSWCEIIIVMWQLTIDGVYLYLNFRNIALRLAAILYIKKTLREKVRITLWR